MKHLCRPGSKRLESTLFPGAAMAQLLRRALSVVSRLSQDSAPMEEQRSKVTVAHMRFVRKCIPVFFLHADVELQWFCWIVGVELSDILRNMTFDYLTFDMFWIFGNLIWTSLDFDSNLKNKNSSMKLLITEYCTVLQIKKWNVVWMR